MRGAEVLNYTHIYGICELENQGFNFLFYCFMLFWDWQVLSILAQLPSAFANYNRLIVIRQQGFNMNLYNLLFNNMY